MNNTELQIVITAVNNATAALAGVSESLNAMADDATGAATEITDSFAATGASIAEDISAGSAGAAVAVDGLATDVTGAATEMDLAFEGLNQKLLGVGAQMAITGALIAAPAADAVNQAANQQEAFDQLGNTVQNVYSNAGSSTSGAATQISKLTDQINSQKGTLAEAEAALSKYSGTTQEVAAAHEKANATIATAEAAITDLQGKLLNLENGQNAVGGSAAQTTAQLEAASIGANKLGFGTTESANALTYLFSTTQNVNETLQAFQDAMDLSAKTGIPLVTASNDVIQAMSGQGRSLRDLGINVADNLSGQTALAAIQEKVQGAAAAAAQQGWGPLNVALAEFNTAMATWGSTVLPTLQTFFDYLQMGILAIQAWAQEHPKLAEATLIFLAVLGLVLVVLGGLIVIFAPVILLVAAFGASFVGIAAVIIAAIALIVAFLVTNWAAIKTETAKLTADVQNTVGDFGNWWKTFWNGVFAVMNVVWDGIKTIVIDYINFVVGFIVVSLQALDPQWRQQWNALSLLLKLVWDGMQAIVQAAVQLFQSDIMTPVGALWTWWQSIWTQFSSFITTIWDGIVTYVSGAVAKLIAMIDTVLKPIQTLGSLAGGGISGLANNIGSAISAISAVGASVTHVQDAIITPGGGVIQTDVADYLIATKNPSALVGAGVGAGSIVININGGSYLDQGGAQQIAAALATQIGRQLKLKNFY
jgi:hypothetical protein